jgi:hypothetical protein
MVKPTRRILCWVGNHATERHDSHKQKFRIRPERLCHGLPETGVSFIHGPSHVRDMRVICMKCGCAAICRWVSTTSVRLCSYRICRDQSRAEYKNL